MSDTAIKRPVGVTIVGILTAILGVINIVFGVWMLMYWLGIKLGTLFEGIGRSRAFGCGLMLVRRVRRK